MKKNYARASQIATAVVPLIFILLCSSLVQAADYSQRISEIDQKIAELEAQKSRALRELKKGLYCSECKRTASEIERAERVSFEQHLRNVKGDAIPASNEVINRKAREYDQRIEALQRERAQLLNQQRQESERQEQARRNQIEADRQAAEVALRRQQQQQQQEEKAERARQFEAATARQAQRYERAQGIANHLFDTFNTMQERDRAWEARKERIRREEEEWNQAFSGSQETVANPAPAAQYVPPPPVVPVVVPEREPYTPPSLGGYVISEDARQFGAEVVVETATILAGQFLDGAPNLRDAASGGIQDLGGRTIDAVMDNFLDSGKDAVKDAAMNLLSEDRKIFVRAMDIPLSILTRNWDAIKEAWAGENSLWVKHVKTPLDTFTVENIVKEASGHWPSGSR